MNILVINGSPKGKYSITLQTCKYLEILHPEHQFEVLNAGQSIKALEKDFSSALAAVEKADILLAYGPNSEGMLTGARTGGMTAKFSRAFTDKEKMIQVLKTLAKPGDAILFKGSRGMRMEQVLEAFLQEEK